MPTAMPNNSVEFYYPDSYHGTAVGKMGISTFIQNPYGAFQ